MSYQNEAGTIRAWFEDGWESGVPIHLIENSKFSDKPDDAPWARLLIRSQEAFPVSIGGPTIRYRHPGSIIVEIRVPEGIGDGRGRELADLACSIVRGKEEDGITVWSARAIPLGVRDGWYRINVLGTFSRDEDFTVQA